METTNWTSTEPRDNEALKFGSDEIKWRSSTTFVGTVLEFGGHDAKALQYRTGQATPSDLLEVASVGQEDESLQDSDRIFADLVGRNVAPHESSNFQADALASITAARVKGDPTRSEKATFWRYLHREGHRLLEKFDADPVREHRLQVHRLGGHIARTASSTIPKIGMTTKPLAWCLFHQEKWTDKHSGLHPEEIRGGKRSSKIGAPFFRRIVAPRAFLWRGSRFGDRDGVSGSRQLCGRF